MWASIVGACAESHFERSDVPLLARYCESVVMARAAAEALAKEGPVVNGRTNAWLVVQEKAIRAMVALAMRLRISPQARRETPSAKGPKASVYEMME